ncbi:MAG TPA: acylphosphatase [Deferrisomatales bacterium]|nr:acylphosphatase [Deferrisomatales bacterium]
MAAEPPETVRARVIVAGRVQGVWFRASTQDTAVNLGVSGWVRNLPGGEVEGVFEGPRGAVEQAVAWCRRGPPGARVESCDVTWDVPQGEGCFAIRP